MPVTDSKLEVYSAPSVLPRSTDYSVKVKTAYSQWHTLDLYAVRVDMHNVREASMATFDFAGEVQVEVESTVNIETAAIRPLSYEIPYQIENNKLIFSIDRPMKLSIELNGERFNNLHLFANGLEQDKPSIEQANVLYVEPGSYQAKELQQQIAEHASHTDIIYFAPGLHRFDDGQFFIPSHKTVYIAGGAAIVGSFICNHVENVTIRGRGMVYLRDIEKTTYWRTVQIDFSRNVIVKDIISIDPPHYSIHLGQSDDL